jgi:hypothetical protein
MNVKDPPKIGHKYKSSIGYIRVYLGRDHHLSDKHSGYALEHRYIAEGMIGRRLKKGEVVHHKDHNRSNNDPQNLEVLPNCYYHNYAHRKENLSIPKIRRHPDEDNPIISCYCGCGARFKKFHRNIARFYVQGHNEIPETQIMIYTLLVNSSKPLKMKEIYTSLGITKTSTHIAVYRLKSSGFIISPKWGLYEPR